jgi:hypothetical protein
LWRRISGSGGGRLSSLWSLGWGGGEAAVGGAGQPPAPHGPPGGGPGTPGPGWPGRWGRHAASGGVRTRPGALAAGEPTAAAADGQGGALGGWTTRRLRPTSSGWLGAPPRTEGSRVAAVRRRPPGPIVAGAVVARVAAGAVVAGGVAGDQDPGDGPAAGQPPTRLGLQRSGVGVAARWLPPWRLSRPTVTGSWAGPWRRWAWWSVVSGRRPAAGGPGPAAARGGSSRRAASPAPVRPRR